MLDFDALDGAEAARAVATLGERALADEDAALAQESLSFTCRIVSAGGLADSDGTVCVWDRPSLSAQSIGARRIGDTVRLACRSGDWALLHPLELTRVATDFQDYWHALLRSEVPRQSHNDAWMQLASLEPVTGKETEHFPSGEFPPSGPRGGHRQQVLEHCTSAVTVIVSTSPAEHHCDADLMMRVIRSLRASEPLRHCRLLLVFDAPPRDDDIDGPGAADARMLAASGRHWVPSTSLDLAARYVAYRQSLENFQKQGDSALVNVEFLTLPCWGHLVGTVRFALERTSTPFVLLHQHDLLLAGDLSVDLFYELLRTLASGSANYVLLNRDVNIAGRSTQYLQAAPHRPELWRAFCRDHALQLQDAAGTRLTPFVGFSDQTHLARADWVRECILAGIGDRKCCMEFVMHEQLLLRWLHYPSSWPRTYMLGGMLDGPYVYDLIKNGTCWASDEDVYGGDFGEEFYVDPQLRVHDPRRLGACLALYVDGAALGRPGAIVRLPDADAERNSVSWQRYGSVIDFADQM